VRIRTRHLLALAGATSLSLTACGRAPTDPIRMIPGAARADNGMGYGSGNRSETDSASAVLSNEVTGDTEPSRNGMGYGSGN
jgi:hypothetical protein